MRTGIALIALGIGHFLSACSIHPLPEDVTRKTTVDIVQQVRCEVRRALEEHANGAIKSGAIAYEFDFQITETNNLSAGATLLNPFKTGGLFSLTAAAGANRTRATSRNFRIADSFREAQSVQCAQEALEKNWVYPIAGDIGMYEVVSTFLRLRQQEDPRGDSVFTFGDTLTFTTVLSAGLSPKLTLSPAARSFRLTEAAATLNAGRTDVHKVTIGLTGGESLTSAMRTSGGARFSFGREIRSSASSSVGVTLLQAEADARGRALIELDRQRLLELQRTKELIVVP